MSLRHAVLSMLHHGPQSGYDLAKAFDRVMRGVWFARKNQMYGELASLTELGFAEVAEEGARGRRSYSVTPAGEDELRRWLIDTEPERAVRDESLLRATAIPLLPRHDAAHVLRRDEAALAGVLQEAASALESARQVEPPTDPRLLGLELQVGLLRARLDWTMETASRMENPVAP